MSAAELRAEFAELISGRVGVADALVPPLVFVLANVLAGLPTAAFAGVGSALIVTVWRLAAKKPIRFAVAGLGGTILASVLALRSGSADAYFVPGIISGGVTTVVVVGSIVAGKPFVAWTSWLTRGWPLAWYWHPRVKPAYTLVSWLWFGFFGIRTAAQWSLYVNGETVALGVVRVLLGWPALVVLLVATYTLGRRRLTALAGPSVEEFKADEGEPWVGQTRGF
jgi:hypothetical protein